ncbi:hypothetical protein HNR07_000960 [Nocardiopsis metallicus]|uniref:Uncharacterized protein n=1 Tax=Nocardiopsis metallicus TaxID=179819 RepID=A0A840W3D9_9ACTN|nr:hypothetical protein [Nocardiopsis metallicus]
MNPTAREEQPGTVVGRYAECSSQWSSCLR